MNGKRCAIIGAPPMSFPWGYDEEDEDCALLKLKMIREITDLQTHGVSGFVVPMDSGVCLYAAEIVNDLREKAPSLELVCVIPYEEQATKWTPELRERYFTALAQCSSTILIGAHREKLCEFQAMLRAVHESDMILFVQSEEQEMDPSIAALEYFCERDGNEGHLP